MSACCQLCAPRQVVDIRTFPEAMLLVKSKLRDSKFRIEKTQAQTSKFAAGLINTDFYGACYMLRKLAIHLYALRVGASFMQVAHLS